ncbi:MAG: tyrosine-type recombinase/integrase [Solirubrobacterales bacterium]|nr:tyrosine-type recombinase/integrase [Solirubrobacterales bacterium]
MFDGMLAGWGAQQRSRMLNEVTVVGRDRLVRRFAEFTNEYPWSWRAQDVEAFTTSLRSGGRAHSTIRGYHHILGLFGDFVCDARYGWVAECEERFGQAPALICHEWNTAAHVSEFEGRPGRRALTREELQRFFDFADDQVDRVAGNGRKGTLAAFRDATMFKVVYAWGLRRREAVMLDIADLHRNAKAPQFGSCGALHVRYGKASRGSPPKRRTVLSVHDWAVEALRQYVGEVRDGFDPGRHPALWMTERRGRVSARHVNARFASYREGAGLPVELDLHCLRHSYVTHLIEAGFPERFVTDQVGHAYAATTAIYTGVSDDYKNRVLARALGGAFGVAS